MTTPQDFSLPPGTHTVALGMGDADVLGVEVEILGVGISDARAISGLPRQPKDKRLHCAQRAVNRGLGQRRTRPLVFRRCKLGLELHRMFNVEPLERLEAGAAFEPQNGLCGLVHRRRIAALCFPQE